jgi:hypothetical protein
MVEIEIQISSLPYFILLSWNQNPLNKQTMGRGGSILILFALPFIDPEPVIYFTKSSAQLPGSLASLSNRYSH